VNLGQAESVARSARTTPWFRGLAGFGATLRRSVQQPGQLLVVGSAEDEPWHFTAHLEALARYRGAPELAPTLVRWHSAPGRGAPGISIEDMTAGGLGRAVLAISDGPGDEELLQRLADARRRGATILGLSGDTATGGEAGGDSLAAVAHEAHTVVPGGVTRLGRIPVACDFELATHLVGVTAVSRQHSHPASRWRPWRSHAAS
jgi:hypothetical protein